MRRWLVLALALLLAGCGSSGSSGPSGQPQISNLTVAYFPAAPRPGQIFAVAIGVTFVDAEGDLVGGTCRGRTASFVGEAPILTAAGTPGNATTGRAACLVQVGRFVGVSLGVTVTLIDRAGHESNPLTTVVSIERPSRD